MKAHLTANSLAAKQAAYEATNNILTEGMFLAKTSALSDAELAAARDAVAATSVVQSIWNGDVNAAVDAINGSSVDLETGAGSFWTEIKPGIGMYGGIHTSISFTVKDSAVEEKSIRASTFYDTAELVTTVLGESSTPENIAKLFTDIETKFAEGCTLKDVLTLIGTGNYGVEVDTDYIGSGYIGPYSGSREFACNNGFEFINLTSGCLVRIGTGYATLDTETWQWYSQNELDSLLLTVNPDSTEETVDLFRGSEASGGSGDLEIIADELTLLVQYAQVLEDPEDVPAEAIMDKIYDADKKYREEQGQTNFFNDQVE